MNRKRIYIFSLVGVFSIWGVFSFSAAVHRSDAVLQAPLPRVQVSSVAPRATNSAVIPVTGEQEPGWTEILVFYGLIGLTALFLIFALLNLANKSTALYVEHKRPPADKTHQN